MSTLQKLKVVQIGVGGFGAKRRKFMRSTKLFELIAAYDLNQDALKECQAEDGAEIIDCYEALLEFPGAEAVIISTGAKFHAEQIIAAAEKGLHVFVEKPLCSTSEELKTLIDVQKKTGVIIGVGHADHFHDGQSLILKEKIVSGEIGQVSSFEKTTCHSGGWFIGPDDWRGNPEKNPGGMLFQCGCHAFHELMFLFGPILEVQSMMRYDVNKNTGTADVAVCLVRFENGILGTVNAYHVSPYRHTLNIFGTKKNLYRTEYFFETGTEILEQTDYRDGAEQLPVNVNFNHDQSGKNLGGLVSFFDAIRKGTQLYPSLIDGARAVTAVFAATKSAQTGTPQQINDLIKT